MDRLESTGGNIIKNFFFFISMNILEISVGVQALTYVESFDRVHGVQTHLCTSPSP